MDVRRFLTTVIAPARSIRATSQPIDLALCLRAVNMQMRNRLRERFHVRNEAVTREIRRDVSWIISLLGHARVSCAYSIIGVTKGQTPRVVPMNLNVAYE
jgi:hypothetical protein